MTQKEARTNKDKYGMCVRGGVFKEEENNEKNVTNMTQKKKKKNSGYLLELK